MPFIKGKSGNPRGRPVGAHGRKTLAREAALRADADAKARAIIYRPLGVRGGRGLMRPPRAANPPARLPEDMAPHDTQTTAALVGALLGIDAATVMEEVELSGREADDWFDDGLYRCRSLLIARDRPLPPGGAPRDASVAGTP